VAGTAADPAAASALLETGAFDALLIDPRLPDADVGLAFVTWARSRWPLLSVVVMGWSDSLEDPARARGACAFVAKNASPEAFVAALLDACHADRADRRHRHPRPFAGSGAGHPAVGPAVGSAVGSAAGDDTPPALAEAVGGEVDSPLPDAAGPDAQDLAWPEMAPTVPAAPEAHHE
jgi:CheY-like chemotaxis protein